MISAAAFILMTALVVVLARGRTARWERQRKAAQEAHRRGLARRQARLARTGMLAATSSRAFRWRRQRRPRTHA